MNLRPYPYPARALIDGALVASSSSCLLAEQNGERPVLWFPSDAVDFSAFDAVAAPGPVGSFGDGEHRRSTNSSDGSYELAVLTGPTSGFESLRGYGTFATGRVDVEVVDLLSSDPRDITIKQFPTWGDVADLLEVMNVTADGHDRFVGIGRTDGHRPVVEGSQMLGQAIVAAGRRSPGRRVVSASMMFVRPADSALPLEFRFDQVSTGRTFTAESVDVWQGQRRCASGSLLLDATAPAVLEHSVAPPDVPGPYESVPFDMAVTGRDIRVVDAAYSNDPDAPVGPPVIDAWVRFAPLPDDPPLHAGLLAQFTGHMSIAAAFRPHAGLGQAAAHRTLSTGINAISIAFHREVRADQWVLYRHLSTWAGDGMTHSECRVHDEAGALLASFTVEAMVRPFADPGTVHDGRTAL